jgi:type I restriction enzyme S subunit
VKPGWSEVMLGEVSDQVRGVTYKKSDSSSTPSPGTCGVVRAGNILHGRLTTDDLVYVPSALVAPRQILDVGDVLVATSSGSIDVVGKAAEVRFPTDVAFGAFCKVLRPGPAVDPRYFAHCFKTPRYRRHVRSAAEGANINNLRAADLNEYTIPLPPIEEQRRIAAVLDAADALRAKRRQAIAKLDTLTQAIFIAGLDGLVSPSPLGAHLTFLTSGARGWAKYYSDSGSRFVRSLDVQMNAIGNDDVVFVDPPESAEARRIRVGAGDVLLTITGSRIGRAAEAPREIAGSYISQHVAIIRVDEATLLPRYLATWLTNPQLGQRQIASRQYGQTKPGLNLDQIRSFELPIPSIETQQELVAAVDSADRVALDSHRSRSQLDSLFASLQQRAFRGEL